MTEIDPREDLPQLQAHHAAYDAYLENEPGWDGEGLYADLETAQRYSEAEYVLWAGTDTSGPLTWRHQHTAWDLLDDGKATGIIVAERNVLDAPTGPDEQQPADVVTAEQQQDEATGGEQQPWPRAQRMPLAVAGGRPQPWHQQAIAEYGAVTGTEMEPNPTIPGGYTATQVNWAITWWNERAELERQLNEQELAWHELRLFSGSHPVDEGDSDVEQHELTHPDQCQTLPPGAACWAERQPFRWWWPTVHGTYRIRPEDLSPLGGDGPDCQMTLRVQVLREGEWFEYTNDIISPDPTDETPAIAERLKSMIAEKAEQQPAAEVKCGRECSEMHTYERGSCEAAVTAEQQQDGAAEELRTFLDALPPRIDIVADWTRGGVRTELTAEALRAVLAERTALAARVAELESEHEADARDVRGLLMALIVLGSRWPAGLERRATRLRERFADRIAELNADTDGGAE